MQQKNKNSTQEINFTKKAIEALPRAEDKQRA